MNKLTIAFIYLVVIGIMTGCKQPKQKMQVNLSTSDWVFKQKDSSLTGNATIPGSIHTDLLNNELIPDPYYRTNEKDLQWIGEKDWIYTMEFDVSKEQLSQNNIELVFEGLDTYAEVYLNDSLILTADNFFCEWRIKAKSLLKVKGNTMKVVFRSPVSINTKKKEESNIPLFDDYVYTRKPAYHFGWDWGPVFITAGIWKPILIESWNNARINDLQIVQDKLTNEEAQLTFVYEIEAEKPIDVNIEINCKTNSSVSKESVKLKKGTNIVKIPYIINNPKRWWSNGLGEAFLYEYQSNLNYKGSIIDATDEKIGLRTIELVQEPDSIGKSFRFELNGVPVFMKGANYIPQDLFLNRPTKKDYQEVINNTLAANMNMLRIWGGGFYENDIFYDLCDENGILVWQDFMFACSMYPGDSKFMKSVKQEAIQNVKRLRNHPCIALWCGNNENYIGWKDWRWSEKYSKQDSAQLWKDYENLYHKLLADVITEFDADRFYWPSSPLFGWGYPVNSEGDVHYWGIWHAQEPFENFQKEKFIGRFMSEYGFQGCQEMSSVKKFTIPEDWDINSETMLMHQKHRIGYPVIDKYMNWYYQKPKDFEAYLYVSQIQQAFGMGIAFEAHRRAMPHCMGTLYWQINDCYPVTSWASVDCYGKWKALHYKTRDLYKEVIVSPAVEDGKLNVYIVSDKLESFDAVLDIKLYDFNGKVLKIFKQEINLKANFSKIYYSEDLKKYLGNFQKDKIVMKAQVIAEEKVIAANHFYFVYPKDLKLKKGKIKMDISKYEKGYELTLTTDVFAKEVFLTTETGEGFFTENFFDLIPGVPVRLKFRYDRKDFNPQKEIKIYSLVDSY